MQLSPAPSLASTAIASPFLFFPLFSLHLSPSLALSIYKPITLRASLHHSTIQTKMPRLLSYIFLILLLFPSLLLGASPFPYGSRARFMVPSTSAGSHPPLSDSKRYEGSSDLIHLRYHMGPVLSSPINLYLIWYGPWPATLQAPLRDFLLSLSDSSPPPPSAAQWWSTVALYSDQTGANVSRRVAVAAEAHLPRLPRGSSLSRLDVQLVIADALASKALPIDHGRGAYIVLTAPGVAVQDFCRAACGFHYFTFPSLVGHTLPYAWVGHSGVQCPDVCAYPFAVPTYMTGMGAMRPPNGDIGVDGMVSVLAHEMAELATNPLVNAWYAGEDPTAPTEIADLCEGVYGSGGGGGYTGQVSKDEMGRSYNLNGRNGRKFLVQWVWSPVMQACRGPNALDY